MKTLIYSLTGLIAVFHIYIVWLEMFAWTTRGVKVFGSKAFPTELFPKTKTLAANQGLYNGFLAAGLFYSLVAAPPVVGFQFKVFFLVCVIVAGVYGGMTVSSRITVVQALPALLAIVATILFANP